MIYRAKVSTFEIKKGKVVPVIVPIRGVGASEYDQSKYRIFSEQQDAIDELKRLHNEK